MERAYRQPSVALLQTCIVQASMHAAATSAGPGQWVGAWCERWAGANISWHCSGQHNDMIWWRSSPTACNGRTCQALGGGWAADNVGVGSNGGLYCRQRAIVEAARQHRGVVAASATALTLWIYKVDDAVVFDNVHLLDARDGVHT